jgi:Ca2+-binding RTX toxin-like protein
MADLELLVTGQSIATTSVIVGTAGDDLLPGTPDADIIEGGLGDDVMIADEGDDTYVFSTGDGNDEIVNLYGLPGDTDTLRLNGFDIFDIWFSEGAGGNLVISFSGGTDIITVIAWFSDEDAQLDSILAAGLSIDRQAINALVAVMAAHGNPTDAGAEIPFAIRDAVFQEIDSSWN